MRTAEQRFMDNVIPEALTGCWIWSGRTASRNRGTLHVNGKQVYAHRFSYATFVGPIPKAKVVCHRCDTPACVNPNHLFIGSQKDNLDDMRNKGRDNVWNRGISHCKRGHEFTPKNTYHHSGRRHCKQCQNARLRLTRLKKESNNDN